MARPLLKLIMLKVMIVDYDKLQSKPLKQSFIDSGFDVIAYVKNDVDLQAQYLALKPDVVIIDTGSPSHDTLEEVNSPIQSLGASTFICDPCRVAHAWKNCV